MRFPTKSLYIKNILDRAVPNIIKSDADVFTILKHYAEPVLRSKLETLSSFQRWSFLRSFKNIDDETFDLLKANPESISIWIAYLKGVQQEILENPNIWLKYIAVRDFIKVEDYVSVATIFKRNIVEALIPPGHPTLRFEYANKSSSIS